MIKKKMKKPDPDEILSFTRKELEAYLYLPCCHVSGMHDPVHFQERKYICEHQIGKAFKRFCVLFKLNPKTQSHPRCGWCKEYPDKQKGEGLEFIEHNKI